MKDTSASLNKMRIAASNMAGLRLARLFFAEAHTLVEGVSLRALTSCAFCIKILQKIMTIAQDSNFALPHAFFADAYFALGTVIISAMPPPEALAKCGADEAIEQYRRTLELDPNFQFARLRLGDAYLAKGMFDEAIAEYERAIALSDRNSSVALGGAYGLSGRKNEARQILRELLRMKEQRYVNPFSIAVVYVGLGERKNAFEWLEKAYRERSYFMVFLKVSNDFEPYRDDPRYLDLMRRIGLA